MTHRWYIVHAYSGFEKKVAAAILDKAKTKNIEAAFSEIIVPTEEVVEVKKGKKRNAERKFFPGYVLTKMEMTDETYHMVKALPKVSGFLGHTQGKPSAVPESEINKILQDIEEGVTSPKPSITFEVGEQVRVSDGPFASFNGLVEEIDEERSRVKVSVSIFGRSTPVELEYTQVERHKMAKEIEGKLKLQVPAGQANPSPPVGPALGQRGINIMDFCKVFNEKSKGEQPGVMLPVVVTYNTDKSFSIEIKLPPASFFIKEALKIKKGSKEPGRDMISTISTSQCRDIAEKKLKDLNANTIEQGTKIIIGSAKSMGIEVTS